MEEEYKNEELEVKKEPRLNRFGKEAYSLEHTMPRNPNGANRQIKDPRQDVCFEIYIRDLPFTGGDAKRAAIEAGYSENFAINVRKTTWFKTKLEEFEKKMKRRGMLSKAERNLDKVLDLPYESETEEGKTKIDIDILKTVVDVSKTITASLGKDEGYSTKTTVEGKTDSTITVNSINYAQQLENNIIEGAKDQAIEQIEEAVIAEVIETE